MRALLRAVLVSSVAVALAGVIGAPAWAVPHPGEPTPTLPAPSTPAAAQSAAPAQSADPVQQAADLLTRLDALALEAETIAEELNGANETLAKLEGQAAEVADREAAAERQLAGAQHVIGERARAAYIHGAPGDELLGVLELPGMTPTNQRLLTYILESDARAVQTAARAFATAEKARRDQENLRAQQLATLDLLTARRAALEQLTADIAREIANADPAVREALARLRTEAEAAAGLDWNTFLASAAGPSAAGLAPSAQAVIAVRTALAQIGDPYVYAATGPDTFDCSGLTVYSYRAAGVSLPRVSRDQYATGTKVALTALLPGDLLYWATDVTNPRTIHHVGMYVGEGRVVHAPRTGDVVRVVPVWRKGLIGATRPSGAVPGDARAVGLPVPPISPAPVPVVPAQPVAPPPAAAAPTPPATAAPPPPATTAPPPPAPGPSQPTNPTTSSPPPPSTTTSPPSTPTPTATPSPSTPTSTPTPSETTTTPAPAATGTTSP